MFIFSARILCINTQFLTEIAIYLILIEGISIGPYTGKYGSCCAFIISIDTKLSSDTDCALSSCMQKDDQVVGYSRR